MMLAKNQLTGQVIGTRWGYGGAKYAWKPLPSNLKFRVSNGVVVYHLTSDIFLMLSGFRCWYYAVAFGHRVNLESKHPPTLRLFLETKQVMIPGFGSSKCMIYSNCPSRKA